jgi:GNAT superfamily N-acetyltransferase
MFEIINSRNFSDELWERYFDLYQEIHKKYYLNRYNPAYTSSELRSDIANKTVNDEGYEIFFILDNDKPVAWFYFTTLWDVLYLSYFVRDEEVNEALLNEILMISRQKMLSLNYSECFNSSYRKANKDAMINLTVPIIEEFVSLRLKRKNMDKLLYYSIINEFIHPEWKILEFNNVPAEFIDQYIECFNMAFIDMLKLSSINIKYQPLTPEQVLGNSAKEINNGKVQNIVILVDNENKVAGFSSVIADLNNKEVIDHSNGFTAVHPKYRGMGIGKYLKANLYISLLEKNAHFTGIITNTKKSNIYINKINAEFGFEPVGSGYVFKLSEEFLNYYLNTK